MAISTMMMAPLPTPPPTSLHPLSVLNQYIASLDDEQPSTQRAKQQRQDEILKTADFLFGAAALDGALGVLEQNCSSTTAAPAAADGGVCSLNVTRLQSPCRSLYTVKGSASRAGRGWGGAAAAAGGAQPADSCYLCLLPTGDEHDKQEATASSSPIYYCSCRSFLEKSRHHNSSVAGGAAAAPAIVCKHLLALKLMPVLGLTCTTVELPSEDEFSRAVLQRVAPQHS